MTEAEYWTTLEYRVTRELARVEEKAIKSLWCDGFIPERYIFGEGCPRITGRAWIAAGQRAQSAWGFVLFLSEATRSREDISWSTLVPQDTACGWLSVDLAGQRIELTPSVTVA